VSFPDFLFEVAWTTDPMADSPSYADVGAVVLGYRLSRGRNRIFDRFRASEAVVAVLNMDGALDPFNPGGAHYGDIFPGRKCRLSATVNSTTYPRITGFIRGMPRKIQVDGLDAVEFRVVDGFRRLNRTRKTLTVAAGTSGAQIVALADAAGWPGTGSQVVAGHRNISTGASTLQSFKLDNRPVLEAMQYVADAELGYLYIAPDGALTFVDLDMLLTDALYKSVHATLGTESGNLPIGGDVAPDFDEDLIYNDGSGRRIGGLTQTSVDAASQAAYGANSLPPRTDSPHETDTEVLDLLDYLVSRLKDPTPNFTSIPILPQTDDGLWPVALGHELGTREKIAVRPRGASYVIEQEVSIEGTDETVDASGHLFQGTLRLSLADPIDYWKVGTSAWSESTFYAP
jgi:hypothetical protein